MKKKLSTIENVFQEARNTFESPSRESFRELLETIETKPSRKMFFVGIFVTAAIACLIIIIAPVRERVHRFENSQSEQVSDGAINNDLIGIDQEMNNLDQDISSSSPPS